MNRVKFISYDGKWPCLCSGTLVLEIDGKVINDVELVSGGYCGFTKDFDEYIEKGPWSIVYWGKDENIMKLVESLKDEITEVVNNNVPQGCCGGCL